MTFTCRIKGCLWVPMTAWETCKHGCCWGRVVDEVICARCFDMFVEVSPFVTCRRPLQWKAANRKVYRDGG